MLTFLAIVSFFGGPLASDLQDEPGKRGAYSVIFEFLGACSLVALIVLINAGAA